MIIERETERLNTPDSFSKTISAHLLSKRDIIVKGLQEVGMKVVVPQAGYFLVADWAELGKLTVNCHSALLYQRKIFTHKKID